MTMLEGLFKELRRRAKGGVLRFDDFVDVALFQPGLGYYAADRQRVGRRADADFTTAAALGPIFGELLTEAAESLLGNLSETTLVEVGVEPGASAFASVAHRFATHKIIRLGDALELPPRSVLVANELLDAQPFRRFRWLGQGWSELGVAILANDELAEVELGPPTDDEALALLATLPHPWHEGATLDIALSAETLLRRLLAPGWSGLALFLDYGKPLAELLEGSPTGTARAYRQHTVHADLLANVGEQDLTCHVVWDRLEVIMTAQGFKPARTERQEAFLVRHAAPVFERWVAAGDPEAVGILKALTHPAHFGGKFQVLWGRR